MENIKISLADAAENRGCSVDYLLALAEAERLDIFARVEGFTATFKNWRGEPMPKLNKRGEPAVQLGPISIGGPSYTTLLGREAAILRSGSMVTVRMVREEGAENGIRIPELSDEMYLMWLAEPQTIGLDQVCVNDEDRPDPKPASVAENTKQEQGEIQTWVAKKPARVQGYNAQLYEYLKGECAAGRAIPKARDVLAAWKKIMPTDVTGVADDSFTYRNSLGQTEVVELKPLGQAITRMAVLVGPG